MWELQKEREAEKQKKRARFWKYTTQKTPPPSLLPPYISPPLRSAAFRSPVIDRQGGFTEPIREELPWLVRNEPGAI